MSAVEELNPKQRAFVEAYLGAANFNATEAARVAGYEHPKQQGSRLLTFVDVAAAIRERLQLAAMDADTCLARLSEQALNSASRFIRVDEYGQASVDLKGLQTAGLMHLVKGIKQTRHGQEVLLYDAQSALELIGRHHGAFTDKQEISGPNGKPIEFCEVTGYDVVKPGGDGSE